MSQAALFSLLAPCLSIGINFVGHLGLPPDRLRMFVLGSVCLLLILAGFIFGLVAIFGMGKGEGKGKAITGVCINGLILLLAVVNFFAYQKIAARAKEESERPKPWSYISGK